ncbi:MAG: hypothetical protein WCK29_04725, partial [archaeon]
AMVGAIFAFAYNSPNPNPAVMGHSSDEVMVNVSGNVMTLQQAIDNNSLLTQNSGNFLPNGYAEQYYNIGEDSYVPISSGKGSYPATDDTCDSNIDAEYTCSPASNLNCYDVRPSSLLLYGKYNVTCRRAKILVNNLDGVSNNLFSFSGNVDSELLMALQGNKYTEVIENGHGNLNGLYSFGAGIPTDGKTLKLYNVVGRGTVSIVQQPSNANGYTAKIDIMDPQGSEGTYSFSLGY